MKPPMDLPVSNIIPPHHLARCGANKAVSLSCKRQHPDSVVDTCQVWCANGCWFASHLGDLRFHSSDWLHISIHGTSFSFFKTLQTFSL